MKKQIEELFQVTQQLKSMYPKLDFPLDGRLVGDIGEALVSEYFQVELYGKNNYQYDGHEKNSNKKIQIKSSMKYNFSFPYKNFPEYYIAVHINEDATLEVVYNGLGEPIREYIEKKGLKDYNKTWYTLTKNTLLELNKKVKEEDRIKRRII